MTTPTRFGNYYRGALIASLLGLLPASIGMADDNVHSSSMFQGVVANTGSVIQMHQNGSMVLTFSEDLVVPDTPAPHWQVADSKGDFNLLNMLKINEDKFNIPLIQGRSQI
ncbi:MAG TPA: hypothetical protein PKD54_02410 [Pirellulaceae bacterium]|nr:hypothetical protein [Pirellulaceae bacterium]